MDYGFCNLAVVSVRREPYNVSEQVSQLLFGETFDILEKTTDKCLIRIHHDSYKGWISKKQFMSIDANDLEKLTAVPALLTTKFLTTIQQTDLRNGQIELLPLSFGSPICYYNYMAGNYAFSIERTDVAPVRQGDLLYVIDMAKNLLNVPYQWGGRSVLGIDCSGFVQLCYRFAGIKLPRDASQQVELGERVDNAQAGDLCFFSQPQHERITHVGIALGDGKIIHASGKVRIDYLTRDGIEDMQTNTLTHLLLRINNFSSVGIK
ncbi:MAG: C40 family peptidase [Bacteroidales bacterium]|jgi:cell wall-associated NlpC family hydrolase|nr:C40 family peptidase [Bacteroidales bacterium]